MPDTPGSLMRHAARAACLLGCLVAATARINAQQLTPEPLAGPSRSPDFLTNYDFQLSAARLGADDGRFSWDTHFGGTLDVIDYGRGRASVVADYEAVLGSEFRPFDPNQAYYTLETSASGWVGSTEIAGVFHHVSRHLSDRAKRASIAWNVLGARLLRRTVIAGTNVAIRADIGRVVQHADVDYQWIGDFAAAIRRPVNSRVGVFARGTAEFISVDADIKHRDTQRGGRIEGGVRISGRRADLELFAGLEQRLDADPRDYVPMRWALAGFRLVNK